jgi:hypothetical protein
MGSVRAAVDGRSLCGGHLIACDLLPLPVVGATSVAMFLLFRGENHRD